MRITYSQIGAFIRIMVSIIHSDDGNAAEASHVAKFINRFKLSDEQKKKLQMMPTMIATTIRNSSELVNLCDDIALHE